MPIPLVDLRTQYLELEDEILSRIKEVLRGMQLFLGENVQALERDFAFLSGAKHGVGVGSGTDAIHLVLRSLGIGLGDEVVTVSHTFVATASAIASAGATPVFVDIDHVTMTMDPAMVEDAITARTRAIMPVHIYGHPADMDPILEIAERHGLAVIEDACQAHGAGYKDRTVGSIGAAAAFSFYFSKNLGAYGEAGMVVTNGDEIAESVRMLRDHGSSAKYVHVEQGYNARLDEIQAAVLLVKLERLRMWNEQRRTHAESYTKRLNALPVVLPEEQSWAKHVYHLYVIRTQQRDALLEWLNSRGIMAGIHYPFPVHMQKPYRELAPKNGLPVTEKVAHEIISLPMYPELPSESIDMIADSIYDFFAVEGRNNWKSADVRLASAERQS